MIYPRRTLRLDSRRARIGAVVTALLAISIVSSGPASAHHKPGHPGGPPRPEPSPTEFALIQPGASPGGSYMNGCVLNFVFQDPAGRLYIGIAGHCAGDRNFDATGQPVQDAHGDRFGEVVFHHPPPSRTNAIDIDGVNNIVADVADDGALDVDDFALIAIDEDRYDDVSPMVRQFGGPSGLADPRDPELGDMVAMYGQTTVGLVLTAVDPNLAEANPVAGRIGPLRRFDDRRFGADVPVLANDSGSPVIDAATGEAIGIVTALIGTVESPTVGDGPTVRRALELAAEAGFRLELVTAPFPPETATVTFTERSATSGQFSDETLFEVQLTDPDGDPIQDAELTFTLTGEQSSRDFITTTDQDGLASVSPTLEEKPGPHQLTVRFAGDENHAGDSNMVSFVVDKEDSAIELSVEGEDDDKNLRARLSDLDAPSDGVSGRTIDFYSDGELIGSDQTDSDGVATIPIPPGHRGANRTFEAVFDGDDFFLGSSDDRPGQGGGPGGEVGGTTQVDRSYRGSVLLL